MDLQTTDKIKKVYEKFIKYLKRSTLKERLKRNYYSESLVMWLMIFQRLQGARSMSNLMVMMKDMPLKRLAGKRKMKETNTGSASSFAMARSRLLLDVVIELTDKLCEWMLTEISTRDRWYVVDGSTFELMKSEELSEKYPPAECGYYPMMRGLICTEINSGITMRPEIGALTGSKQAGEIQLFKKLINRLPKGSKLMGDRNFGIYTVAKLSQEQGLDVVLRLTEMRAKKINGGKIPVRCVKDVIWYPSRDDLKANPELDGSESVSGKLISTKVTDPNGKSVDLYVFTTLEVSEVDIIKIYQKRWRIEVDIKDIKKSMDMNFLRVKSEDMALKELYLGICAYNLVREIIFVVTDKLKIDPRKIGFLRAKTVVEVYSMKLLRNHTRRKQRKIIKELYAEIQNCMLPNRKNKNRHEPRAVLRDKRSKYPTLKGNRNDYK